MDRWIGAIVFTTQISFSFSDAKCPCNCSTTGYRFFKTILTILELTIAGHSFSAIFFV